MTRPIAAYVGMGLPNPIRVVMNRGLHASVAKLITIDEALELVTDLTSAISRACAAENKELPNAPAFKDSVADNPGGSC